MTMVVGSSKALVLALQHEENGCSLSFFVPGEDPIGIGILANRFQPLVTL
jgi:hypothetical protein